MKIKLVVAVDRKFVVYDVIYIKCVIVVAVAKLEHVALNSASETGAKMHQNAQI